MKKIITFLIILFSLNKSQAQTNIYHPFPDSNATWVSYYEDVNSHDTTKIFFLNGDTNIFGVVYAKLYFFNDFLQWDNRQYAGALRQDTLQKRVYARVPDFMYPLPFHYQDTGEVLLYDFSLQIGDSINIPSVFGNFQFLKVVNIELSSTDKCNF